jgi:DNA-binding NtrC family response regulator
MPSERSSRLKSLLTRIEATIREASSCEGAAAVLRDDSEINLVLTDLTLPDGNWFDVINLAGDLRPGVHVVVCGIADERLWTNVLEVGGFDVLVDPYQQAEVNRVVSTALKSHTPRQMAAEWNSGSPEA